MTETLEFGVAAGVVLVIQVLLIQIGRSARRWRAFRNSDEWAEWVLSQASQSGSYEDEHGLVVSAPKPGRPEWLVVWPSWRVDLVSRGQAWAMLEEYRRRQTMQP